MAAPRRWFRLDCDFDDTEWLCPLSAAARFTWVKVLDYTKANGRTGRVKALAPAVAATKWRIPVEDVEACLAAAQRPDPKDGKSALEIVDREWVVTKLTEYNPYDMSAAERTRRYRESKSRLSDTKQNRNRATTSDETRKPVTQQGVTPPSPHRDALSRATDDGTTEDNDNGCSVSTLTSFATKRGEPTVENSEEANDAEKAETPMQQVMGGLRDLDVGYELEGEAGKSNGSVAKQLLAKGNPPEEILQAAEGFAWIARRWALEGNWQGAPTLRPLYSKAMNQNGRTPLWTESMTEYHNRHKRDRMAPAFGGLVSQVMRGDR